jgi:hypothetical protein
MWATNIIIYKNARSKQWLNGRNSPNLVTLLWKHVHRLSQFIGHNQPYAQQATTIPTSIEMESLGWRIDRAYQIHTMPTKNFQPPILIFYNFFYYFTMHIKWPITESCPKTYYPGVIRTDDLLFQVPLSHAARARRKNLSGTSAMFDATADRASDRRSMNDNVATRLRQPVYGRKPICDRMLQWKSIFFML